MKKAVWLLLLVTVSVVLGLASLIDNAPSGHEALAAPPLSLEGYLDERAGVS